MKFPDWRKAVLPTEPPRAVWRMRLPEWLSIRPKTPLVRAAALVGGASPGIRIGCGPEPDVLAGIDLRYLRPYALAGEVCVGVHGDKEPILFADTPAAIASPLGALWFGVVMPVRMDASDSMIINVTAGK